MTDRTPIVFIIDDDREVGGVLREIVEATGFSTLLRPSAESFLQEDFSQRPGCVLLDLQLPGMSGLELQQRLLSAAAEIPVIFLTGHASIDTAVKAMRAGAFTYLEKPVSPSELQRQVRAAIEYSLRRREAAAGRREALQRVASLSERERQVMNLLVDAKTPKWIASHLGISSKTVEFHRANLLAKMHLDGVSELIRFSLSHGLTP